MQHRAARLFPDRRAGNAERRRWSRTQPSRHPLSLRDWGGERGREGEPVTRLEPQGEQPGRAAQGQSMLETPNPANAGPAKTVFTRQQGKFCVYRSYVFSADSAISLIARFGFCALAGAIYNNSSVPMALSIPAFSTRNTFARSPELQTNGGSPQPFIHV